MPVGGFADTARMELLGSREPLVASGGDAGLCAVPSASGRPPHWAPFPLAPATFLPALALSSLVWWWVTLTLHSVHFPEKCWVICRKTEFQPVIGFDLRA